MSAPRSGATRVLIVDDSALVRRLLSEALSRYADIEVVGTARDPFEARERIIELAPDVITLDIEMPRMDGLTFLEKLMKAKPMRVVVVSSVAQASSAHAIRALYLGAVQVVPKPGGEMSVPDVERFLIRAVRHAAMVPLSRLRGPARRVVPAVRSKRATLTGNAARRLIAIGASTGGPPAIEAVLTRLPADAPGIVVAQHMPPTFTAAFANRLDGLCAMRVHEANDNELIRDGVAYIAPGGRHLVVRRTAEGLVTHLKDGPFVHHQRPAVDVLFDSVADVCGASAIGVLLTGMGADGARGLLAMKEAGAWTMTQDEETCVVYGMPREAVVLDAAHEVLPLELIADAITHQCAPVGAYR
ncbi:MAG: chemotaxis response regulator protein-glutamate methylesterase [Gemmatimonadaceae bacterium]